MRLLPRLLLCAAFLLPLPASAQDQKASLVADSVEILDQDRLVAQGHVEVFYGGRRLSASRILYDRTTDRLTIEGPIVIDDGQGQIVLADQGALDGDLANGVLTSARLVLGQQLQLAATELRRVGDRYTALGRTVASSCQVCAENPTPLWEVRASRVVHDELERQIHFEHASLRIAGLPVGYIPHLRIPEPGVTRATGLLRPAFRTTSKLGTGVILPYFITLGDSRDLTLSPQVSTKGGRTLGLRYREAFSFGAIEIEGATSRDDILPDDQRGYIEARGSFALPQDFRLDFQIEEVSDRGYYLDYGLGDRDRLVSGLQISRTRRDEHVSGRLLKFRSLRDEEDNDTIPALVGELSYDRRLDFGRLGGEGGLRLDAHGHRRSSGVSIGGDGRDMARLSAQADWRREWLLPAGVLGALSAELGADAYDIRDDAEFEGTETRLRGAAAAELRWPWVRATADGTSDLIQPILQVAWADASEANVPNEDSPLVEFDEANLFELNRFPGRDAAEDGHRLAVGVNWTRVSPDGWTLGATLGRILQQKTNEEFSNASGFDGSASDWLAALTLDLPSGLLLGQRTVLDPDFGVTKTEWRIAYAAERYDVTSHFVHFRESDAEDRLEPISELKVTGGYRVTDHWTARVGGIYDFEDDRTTWASAGLGYRTECIDVALSLSRRFTTSTNVAESTDFGLSVDLIGLGSGAAPGPARVCRR